MNRHIALLVTATMLAVLAPAGPAGATHCPAGAELEAGRGSGIAIGALRGPVTERTVRMAILDSLRASGAVMPPDNQIRGGWLSGAGNLDGTGREDVLALSLSFPPVVSGLRGSDGTPLWSYTPDAPEGLPFAYPRLRLDSVPGDDAVVGSITFQFDFPTLTLRIRLTLAGISGATGEVLWENAYQQQVGTGPVKYSLGLTLVQGLSPDLDGDTFPDMVLARYDGLPDAEVSVATFTVLSLRTGRTTSLVDAGIRHRAHGGAFARVLPDANGDGLDEVVTMWTGESGVELRARTGQGVLLWNGMVPSASPLWPTTGLALDPDGLGDLLLVLPCAADGSAVTTILAISGADGATTWETSLPGGEFFRGIQPSPDLGGESGRDLLFATEDGQERTTYTMRDGSTGALLWRYEGRGRSLMAAGAGAHLPGDATGDGIPDVFVLQCEDAAGGCGPGSRRELISGRDASVIWTRPFPEEGYETISPAGGLVDAALGSDGSSEGGDLDGDGGADLLVAHTLPDGSTEYTAISGASGSDLWPSRLVFEGGPLFFVEVVDLRPGVTGGDLLENFHAEGHVDGLAARPGTGGAPLWTFAPGV